MHAHAKSQVRCKLPAGCMGGIVRLRRSVCRHAGIHRGLGVHISKVRSCTLDTWLPEQVAFMARTGNAAANAHFEARLQAGQKPSYYSPELETFIRRKVNILWIMATLMLREVSVKPQS